VIDSAARLGLIDTSPAARTHKVADLKAAVHVHALGFPTVPTIDQLPALLRDYVAAHHVTRQVGIRRAYSSMAYLAAFIGANLASWQDYAQATLWYRKAPSQATRAGDREATGWIAARSTLITVHRGDHRQVMHDAAYAVAISVRGQLGSTLGNALGASTAARLGHREIALMALRDAERATEDRGEETFTYPTGAVTDRTFLALDHADCLRQDGYPREAARQATRTLLSLTPECALPVLLDRADEVANAIGIAGRSDTEDLREVLRSIRDIGT
jgi:hypothetical protein